MTRFDKDKVADLAAKFGVSPEALESALRNEDPSELDAMLAAYIEGRTNQAIAGMEEVQ